MKSKLYRVLVLLVAIAMMIPSFALAEGEITTAKLQITSEAKTITDTFVKVDAGQPVSGEKNTIRYAYDIPTNALEAKLTWTSSNEKVATVGVGQVPVAPGESKTEQTIAVLKQGVGEATITGSLVVDNGTPLTAEFTVKFTAVDVTKIEFAAPEGQTITTKYKAGTSESFYRYVRVTAPETGATYDKDDVAYRMTDGTGAAEVDKYGNVTFKKAGTATLQAYIPGSSATPATLTLTVIPEDAEDDPQEQPENVYTYLAFTSNVEGNIFTTKNGEFDLSEKLVTRPAEGQVQDKLIWSVDDADASIASVDNGGWVRISKPGAKVKVTVASQKNPNVPPAFCYVEYVKGEDSKKAYTTVEFKPASATVRVGEQINLYDYLITKGPDDCADEPVWTTLEDPDDLGGDYGNYTPMKAGEFKVTVRSKLDPSKTSDFTINAVEAAEGEGYTKVAFSTDDTLEVKKSRETSFNISKYLVLEGEGDFYDLIFTSSDTSIATVYALSVNDIRVTFKNRAQTGDTVKIEVRYKKSAAELSDTLTMKYAWTEADEKFTKVEFRAPKTVDAGLDEGFINAKKYLVLEGNGDEDDLIWTSSDERIADVDMGIVSFKDIDWEEDRPGAKDGATVNITVRYQGADNKTFTDTLIVNIKRPEKPYTSIKFSQDTLTVTGETDLSKYLVTEGNDYHDDSLIWTSSNQQIALVNEGTVTIKDAGEVTITVRSEKDEKVTASIVLKIEDTAKAIEAISLTQSEFTLKADDDDGLFLGRYVVTKPAIGETDDELIWTSDDLDKVSIDASGNVYCLASLNNPGKAVVTVRSKLNADVKAQFTITLEEADALKSIKFVDAPKTYKEGSAELNLNDYVVTDPVDYKGGLYWDSSDPQVAIVRNDGIVEFRSQGKVTFTVSDKKGTKATCEIEMIDVDPVEKIELKDIALKVGEKEYLYRFFNLTPKDTYPKDITFVSSNRDVAEVQLMDAEDDSFDGLRELRGTLGWVVVGYKAGETTITANVENWDGSVVKGSCKVTVTEVEVESVEFAAKKYTLKMNTKLNEKVRFNLAPFNASNIDASDVYVMTNNTDVIDVEDPVITDKGKGYVEVFAKKPGKAWIGIKRTSDDKLLGTVKIVVETVRVKRFKLPKNAITLYWYDDGIPAANAIANRTYQNYYILTPVVTPSKANYTVSYETSDPSVAFVEDGRDLEGYSAKIVASGVGKCTITVKVDDGEKVRVSKLKVTVAGKTPKPVIDQKKVTLNMEKGPKSITLNVYDDNTKQALKVTWASSDKKVAKVNKNGKVTAVGAGKATITATHKDTGKTLKCIVTVKAKSTENADKVKKITGDAKVSVKVGEKKTLNIKVKPAGAKVTFKSSDTSIVKVGKDGQIKGVKAGKATITVSGDGVEFKIKVTVKK